jgi:hypothetical protein
MESLASLLRQSHTASGRRWIWGSASDKEGEAAVEGSDHWLVSVIFGDAGPFALHGGWEYGELH